MTLSLYLAAPYSRRHELRGYRDILEAYGCTVTSRWIDTDEEDGSDPLYLEGCAEDDLMDIRACDVLIAFTEPKGTTATSGGRHWEAGYAAAKGKRIIVVGAIENIYYYLADYHLADVSEVIPTLALMQEMEGVR